MASIFTGQTPSLETADFAQPLPWNGKTWCGMARFATPGDAACIPSKLETLAERMKQHGYWTMGVASNPYAFDPYGYSQGFDDWRQVGEIADRDPRAAAPLRDARAVNSAVIQAIKARQSDKFFLYVHYMDVHDHSFVSRPNTQAPLGQPTTAGGILGQFRGAVSRSYARAVTVVDAAIGGVIDELRSNHLLKDAIVIVTADHGEHFFEQHALAGMGSHLGNPSFEEVLRVPFVVWPQASGNELPSVIRGQDTRFLIEGMVGMESGRPPELRDDEVLLTEMSFLTYRRFPDKVMRRRKDGKIFHFNLANDPRELRDIADQEPDSTTQCQLRMDQLAGALQAAQQAPSTLSEGDRQRLRSLGYIE